MWQRGLLNLIDFEGKIHRDCLFCGVPMYSFLRYIGIFYFRGIPMYLKSHFLPHTSESPKLGAPRCIITLVSVGDTSGLRFQCPSRCTEVQIYLNNTSGWANIGHFRCIAKNCQNKIHRNSKFSSNPDVFQLISRDSTRFSSKCIPAQADFNKNIHRNSVISFNPDVSQLISREYTYIPSQHTPARINLTLISREYTCFPSKPTPARAGLT